MKRSRPDEGPEIDIGPLSPEEELEAKRLAEIAARGFCFYITMYSLIIYYYI
jgi:hypothetical protein